MHFKNHFEHVQVFELLHPIDLFHVSRTSKSFRALLTSPSTQGLWRTSFLRNSSQVPYCPTDVPILRWVDLLFGPAICHVSFFHPVVSNPNITVTLFRCAEKKEHCPISLCASGCAQCACDERTYSDIESLQSLTHRSSRLTKKLPERYWDRGLPMIPGTTRVCLCLPFFVYHSFLIIQSLPRRRATQLARKPAIYAARCPLNVQANYWLRR